MLAFQRLTRKLEVNVACVMSTVWEREVKKKAGEEEDRRAMRLWVGPKVILMCLDWAKRVPCW